MVALTVREDHRTVVPPHLVETVQLDILLHLLNLQQDEPRGWVAVAVVFDQEGDTLLFTTVGQEEAWTFRQKPDAGEDNEACEALQEQREPPRPVARHVRGAKRDQCGGDRSTKPATVVEACTVVQPSVAEKGLVGSAGN